MGAGRRFEEKQKYKSEKNFGEKNRKLVKFFCVKFWE